MTDTRNTGTHEDDSGRSGRGGPPGNRNRWRHGLRSPRVPKGSRINIDADRYRRALENAVVATYGEVDVCRAGCVATATAAAAHAMKCAKWLRDGWDEMSWSERVQVSREIVTASEKRDTAVRRLDLDFSPEDDPWSALDSPRLPAPPPDDGNGSSGDAADAAQSGPAAPPTDHTPDGPEGRETTAQATERHETETESNQ